MRTVIIGNSGSGKTWLAQRLAEKHAIAISHLDEIFWMPAGFDTPRPEEEVSALIESVMRSERWLVEGVFGDLASRFLPFGTELLWLDLPWHVCKRRLEARGSESKAHMGRAETERGLRELLQWASNYNSRTGACSRIGHNDLFNSFTGKRYRFTEQADVQKYLNNIYPTLED